MRQIFRQAALERLSSPEQLDQLLRVTTLRGWLALLAIIGLIVTVAAWSVSDTIPTQMIGHGILLRGGRVLTIPAPATGQVQQFTAQPGMTVAAGQKLGTLRDQDGRAVDLNSPFAGRVVSVNIAPNGIVVSGLALVNLEALDQPLEAVIYMPPEQGKNVQPGMAVQVTPSNINREEFGFMHGRVRSVASFPSTPDAMEAVLANPQLVTTFMANGAPIEVHIDLDTDPATPSGYRWSSSGGPPTAINGGTLCDVAVTLEEQHPIDLVLPKR